MSNPFELTFGIKPENYISRLKQTDEIVSTFSNSNSNKVFLITGTRGSGKTVLLSSISKYFEEEKDWIVIELVPSYDMLEQLGSALYDSSLSHKIFSGKTFGFSFEGISFSISGDKPVTNIITLLENILKKITKVNKKVLICVDEISNNAFVKPFVQAFQILLRKKYPLYLLMTGLFQNIYKLQDDKALTFLYRAPKIVLDPLSTAVMADSYENLLSLNKNEAIKCAKESKGYAYAYQVIGYLLYENKAKSLNGKVLSQVDQYLQEYVYDKTWSELSDNDKRFLKAFSTNKIELVENLIKKTEMDKKTFSVYRDRLIKRGLVHSVGYGKLELSLPRFVEFMSII